MVKPIPIGIRGSSSRNGRQGMPDIRRRSSRSRRATTPRRNPSTDVWSVRRGRFCGQVLPRSAVRSVCLQQRRRNAAERAANERGHQDAQRDANRHAHPFAPICPDGRGPESAHPGPQMGKSRTFGSFLRVCERFNFRDECDTSRRECSAAGRDEPIRAEVRLLGRACVD